MRLALVVPEVLAELLLAEVGREAYFLFNGITEMSAFSVGSVVLGGL